MHARLRCAASYAKVSHSTLLYYGVAKGGGGGLEPSEPPAGYAPDNATLLSTYTLLVIFFMNFPLMLSALLTHAANLDSTDLSIQAKINMNLVIKYSHDCKDQQKLKAGSYIHTKIMIHTT